MSCFLLVVAAYVFGLLTVVVAVRGRRYEPSVERRLGRSIRWLLAIVGICVGTVIIAETVGGSSWSTLVGVVACATAYAVFVCLRTVRGGPDSLLAARWYASLCAVGWFSYWVVGSLTFGGAAHYGMWVSIIGSIVILISVTAEARVRSMSSWRATISRLALSRMETVSLDEPHCAKCGYLLIGLTVPRCPECGERFEGTAAAPTAFVEHKRAE